MSEFKNKPSSKMTLLCLVWAVSSLLVPKGLWLVTCDSPHTQLRDEEGYKERMTVKRRGGRKKSLTTNTEP